MKPILIMAAVTAALALGACSKNPLKGKDAALLDASPGINTERLDAEGKADFLLAYQYVQSSKVTTIMPGSGSARYVGGMGGDVSGDVDGFMTGALEMTVANLNDGTISGFADNFALYDEDGSKKEDLSGTITMTGNVVGNGFSTTGAGTLSHSGGSSAVNSDLDGTFRNVDGKASGVSGVATTTGGITMDDGRFYLVEND
ncbi:hypothetical protein [uncultured Maritimibacter sp.]|jgi:hypothetical protein|uniref:hypothetical protein n=1 Tax=uncultured Maritimibacter sp. TaxID=991866 RepID=UPI002618900A|nr:hypothetical protein [uncultured Maritimibacter sp.]